MNKIIFSTFVFIATLSASDIFACTCMLPSGNESFEEQVKKAYKNSTTVFSSEVVEVIKKPDAYFVAVKFKVDKSWKNKFQGEITITTS